MSTAEGPRAWFDNFASAYCGVLTMCYGIQARRAAPKLSLAFTPRVLCSCAIILLFSFQYKHR